MTQVKVYSRPDFGGDGSAAALTGVRNSADSGQPATAVRQPGSEFYIPLAMGTVASSATNGQDIAFDYPQTYRGGFLV